MTFYTADRIEDGFYVFLLRDDERQQLTLAVTEISETLSEGDLVTIEYVNSRYNVQLATHETEHAKKKVANLLEKLKNKK